MLAAPDLSRPRCVSADASAPAFDYRHLGDARRTADLSLPGIARLARGFMDRLDLGGRHAGRQRHRRWRLVQLASWPRARPAVRAGGARRRATPFATSRAGLTGKTLVASGRLSPRMFGVFMQQMRFRAVRRLPIAFGWLTKRGDAVVTRWMRPVLTQAGIRRDTVRVLRAAAASARGGLLAGAAERLPEFKHPALVVWASEDRVMPPAHGARLAACCRMRGWSRWGQLHAHPAGPARPAGRDHQGLHLGPISCRSWWHPGSGSWRRQRWPRPSRPRWCWAGDRSPPAGRSAGSGSTCRWPRRSGWSWGSRRAG